ncbi:hypothetical protein, partial [Stenotrophomonas sp. CASM114]|uniref:hypothetical protein n=1 Tax=Stenotrophomonas sp. CASM114 TaxID=3111512 RepID=UPI003BF8443E
EQTNQWFKCDAVALAAVQEIGIDADHYLFIESDVLATQDRWKALFRDLEKSPYDCVTLTVGFRTANSTFRWWDHHGTPAQADRHHILAVYRLSKRAVEASIEMAVELRNCFCEVAVPYVMQQAGLSCGLINGREHHSTARTMGPKKEFIHE